MLSTFEAIEAVREANPGARVTEDRVRHVLRRRSGPKPSFFSGRLVWTHADVQALAVALGLLPPVFEFELAGSAKEAHHG